jgi:hypothetical protein
MDRGRAAVVDVIRVTIGERNDLWYLPSCVSACC